MTPDHEKRAVDSALNGDEPAEASDAPERVGSNGSDGANGQPSEEQAPEASVAPDVAEPESPEQEALEPASAAEDEEAEEADDPLAPVVEEAASTPEPQATDAVPEPLVKEEAPVTAPERPGSAETAAAAEEPSAEEPSGIAADIERALQAATTPATGEEAEQEVPAEPPAPSEAPAEVPAAEAESEPAADGAEAEEDEVVLRAFQPGDWFVVHTYAGYENKVKTNLESRISSMNVEEKIFEVVIPMEDVMEIKSGKKQVVQRKVFPGYLLVRMDLDDDSWYVVRNTPGVTGFVGSGARPIPLSEREVDRILQRKPVGERPKPKLEWSINDPVRVTTGPFANFQGLISEIDTDRSKLKVLVNIFGRETPVELGFDQVSKV